MTDRRLCDVTLVGNVLLTAALFDVLYGQPLAVFVPGFPVDVVPVQPSTDCTRRGITHVGDVPRGLPAIHVLFAEKFGVAIPTRHRRPPSSIQLSTGPLGSSFVLHIASHHRDARSPVLAGNHFLVTALLPFCYVNLRSSGGRCTVGYLADETEYSRQHIHNRSNVLLAAEYVDTDHAPKGLYALRTDPRKDEQGRSVPDRLRTRARPPTVPADFRSASRAPTRVRRASPPGGSGRTGRDEHGRPGP